MSKREGESVKERGREGECQNERERVSKREGESVKERGRECQRERERGSKREGEREWERQMVGNDLPKR